MRIAFISPGYAPTVGGVETHVTHLAERLSRLGHDVEVWAQDHSVKRPTEEQRSGVTVRRFPRTGSDRYPVSASLWRHVRTGTREVDLVHAQSYHVTASLAALLTARNVPVVFTPHYHGTGHTRLGTLMHRPYRVLGAQLFARADVVIAVSAVERSLITRDFPSAEARCEVISNAVDAQWIREATPFANEPATLLALGRMEPYKRLDLVVDAFSRCSAGGQLVILGDGPDAARLRSLSQRLSHGRQIRFLGQLDTGEVARWLRTTKGVISMSEHEAFGLVALEGLAAGAQVILSDLPAHREVLELATDPAAVMIQPGDVGRLSAEMDRVLAEPRGEQHRVRDWCSVAQEHLQLYERCLAASNC